MVKRWKQIRSQVAHVFRIFSVRTDTTVSPRTGTEHDFYIIESQDWINVIPLTDDDRVVMVRQYRHGLGDITLEIPGGMLDAGDTPGEAASRELLEETGYEAQEWAEIAAINPNPAIFSNRCYTFLARNVRQVRVPSPDTTEDIDVVLVPLNKIPNLIRAGKIDHAIVISAFYLHSLHRQRERTHP